MLNISTGRRAIAVSQYPEQQRTHRPKCLRKKNRAKHIRWLGAEFRRDGIDAENQQKKVEAVQRPAKERSNKCVALRWGQALKVANKGH